MAKSLSITALEKQFASLEKKITQAKSKKIIQLEKSVKKIKTDIKKNTLKINTEKARLKLAKTPIKKGNIKQKIAALKDIVGEKKIALEDSKKLLVECKQDYKDSLYLLKVKATSIKEAAKPRRRKKVLGKKVKAKKISPKTIVPATFLGIDTSEAVSPINEIAQAPTNDIATKAIEEPAIFESKIEAPDSSSNMEAPVVNTEPTSTQPPSADIDSNDNDDEIDPKPWF